MSQDTRASGRIHLQQKVKVPYSATGSARTCIES